MDVNENSNLEHKLIKVLDTPPPDDDEDPRGHPFTNEIVEAQLPSKWKGMTIRLYDGSTDPNEHLNVFKTQMTLYTTNKVVCCKVFPTSLQEGTLN